MKTAQSILKVLAWYDLFQYPLTVAEIRLFLDHPAEESLVSDCLLDLMKRKLVFRSGHFYALQDDPLMVLRRLEGNKRAVHLLKKAHRIARLLYHFPFVRGIGISGSLSKNFAGPDADIDLFIMTAANRLWIARTLMHGLKKLSFLIGKQHWFCMNYYIDEEALTIPEQNIFTATEMITLMPVCGNGTVSKFYAGNEWVKNFYPAYTSKTPFYYDTGKKLLLKRIGECLFDHPIGNRLDSWLMKQTAKRWQQKEEREARNSRGGRIGLDTGKHIARPRPGYFQHSILTAYSHKLATCLLAWELSIQDKPMTISTIPEIVR